MLFSQNALVFAAEGADPVSQNETVEAPVQAPADGEVTTPEENAPVEGQEDAQDIETPEEVKDMILEPAGEETGEDAVPKEEAKPKEASQDVPEEAAGVSGNTTSDNSISLSGGSITISINSISENLTYAKGVTVSQSSLSKNARDTAGFDFSVVSGGSAILKKGEDYSVSWYFKPADSDGYEIQPDDILPDSGGTLTVSINGISKQTIVSNNTTITGYTNWISIKVNVKKYEKPGLSENEVVVSASYNRVTVTNSSNDVIYVDLIEASSVSGDGWDYGDKLAKGEKKVYYTYFDEKGEKKSISASLNLAVVADREEVFAVSQAQVAIKFTTPKDTGDQPPLPKDGSEINMKAVVNKGTQTIKITWNPAANLKYKYYELQRLEADGETFKTLANWPNKYTKKQYTYGKTEIERAEQPAVFKLICYDADKRNPVEYATVAAPSLLYVEQGYTADNLEYCFSKLYDNADLSYRLELAEKNADTGKNGKKGFNDITPSEYPSGFIYEIEGFRINKTVSVDALRQFFTVQDDGFKIEAGKQYFARVKSIYFYHGQKYTSAPSNVVSKKAGPPKAYVFDVNGMKYEKPAGNPQKKREAEDNNKKRMDEYLTELYNDSVLPLSSNYYIHRTNESPDAKSGYIVFMAERTKEPLKGYELLRSDSQYGTYKKLKLYKVDSNNEPVQFSGLYKWVPSDPAQKEMFDLAGYDVYYMQYNNFPPETRYYYAVRGVYKAGNAQGGFGDGWGCTAQLDKVENIFAFDGTINKINLYWSLDNCVKEYWIYKREYTDAEEAAKKDPSEFTSLDDYKLLKKVKAKKSGTLKEGSAKKADKDLWESTSGNLAGDYVAFIDKNGSKYVNGDPNEVKEGHTYQYVIVPKYDTKNKDKNYNLDKRSDVAYGMATLAGAKIQNFTAKNYSCGKIILRWNKFKNVEADYLIIRTTMDPRSGGEYWKDAKLEVIHDKGSYLDETPVVGQKYFYIIFAGSERSATVTDGALKAARSVPLAVAEAKLSGGNSFRRGPRISWTVNQRDRGAGVEYRIQRRGGGDWVTVKKNLYGSGSWVDDTAELRRGVKWEYRVLSFYDDVSGGVKEAGSYSKPSKIEVNADRTSLMVGETVTVTVYPKIDGGDAASDIRMDDYSTSGSVSVTDKEYEGDHINYKIKANSKGSGSVTFKAYDHDWTSGSSSSDLKKTVSFTVR